MSLRDDWESAGLDGANAGTSPPGSWSFAGGSMDDMVDMSTS